MEKRRSIFGSNACECNFERGAEHPAHPAVPGECGSLYHPAGRAVLHDALYPLLQGLVTVSADRRTVGSVLCGCVGIVLVCTGVKALALPNLICILAAVLGSVAAYAVILLGMKNPLVLEYLEKAKQKFRKTS